MHKTRIAVLISGRGSNMVALADAIKSNRIQNAEIALVVSDKPDAGGLFLAQESGLETFVCERRGRKREEHEREIIAALQAHQIEIVCLAGYMRLLSPCF